MMKLKEQNWHYNNFHLTRWQIKKDTKSRRKSRKPRSVTLESFAVKYNGKSENLKIVEAETVLYVPERLARENYKCSTKMLCSDKVVDTDIPLVCGQLVDSLGDCNILTKFLTRKNPRFVVVLCYSFY